MRIKLEGLTKAFDGHVVLDHIDFEDEIRTMAVIGTSGGGKSTLLRILGGLLPVTEGEVTVDGMRITDPKRSMMEYRRKIGYVFQQNGLLKHLTALENVTMPLIKVHHYTKAQALERALGLLDRFGLKDDAGKYPLALSGGQSQRIAIARAVAPGPEFLLLDEPTSALDPEYTVEVLDMIEELKEENMDFVIVTHEMGFARQACDKTMFLQDGKLLAYGGSGPLFAKPAEEPLRRFLKNLSRFH